MVQNILLKVVVHWHDGVLPRKEARFSSRWRVYIQNSRILAESNIYFLNKTFFRWHKLSNFEDQRVLKIVTWRELGQKHNFQMRLSSAVLGAFGHYQGSKTAVQELHLNEGKRPESRNWRLWTSFKFLTKVTICTCDVKKPFLNGKGITSIFTCSKNSRFNNIK